MFLGVRGFLVAGALLLLGQIVFAQESATIAKGVPVKLRVEAGRPLRLYITRRAWYRMNETIDAKFAEPVWAFDRIVIPAGTVVHGQVTRLDPVPGMVRARAIVGGDFTPLKRAEVSFTSLTLADGRTLPLQTQRSLGLATIYVPATAKKPSKKHKKQKTNPGKPNRVAQFLKRQAQTQMNARSRGFFDLIRGPNKREWLEDFLLEKLPYHPQWYRTGTRFDAVLEQPVDFGKIVIGSEELQTLGAYPPSDAVAQMRILSNLSSSDARVGDSMDGVLSEPLFTADHKLVLPQGTQLDGKITLAHRARLFHRGGQLRFAIEKLNIPMLAAEQRTRPAAPAGRVESVQAQLTDVEADPGAVKVDPEGTAKATESKTRLLRPVIAGLVASKSLDNDAGKQTASGGAAGANTSGRALGGFSGFGLLGIAAAQGPRNIGAALGFYGLAWSVYSNVIARGREVTFEKNTAMAIRFGAPPRKR